jgi:hypothetical protein
LRLIAPSDLAIRAYLEIVAIQTVLEAVVRLREEGRDRSVARTEK